MSQDAKQEKRIEDYLHLYLGCEVEHSHLGLCKMIGITNIHPWLEGPDIPLFRANPKQVKPILRPLSDMTEEERNYEFETFINIPLVNLQIMAEDQRWLLLKGFDIFGLIESGLAIDKAKIKIP